MHGCIDLSVTPTAHKPYRTCTAALTCLGLVSPYITGVPEGHLFISVPIYGHASASVGFK